MKDFPFCQYDADTVQGTPNFLPGKYAVNVGKGEYMGYIYDEFIQVPENCNYCYDFILVNNGKVIAMGNEQGRCGGITATCENKDFAERIKLSPAYDKVKHLPIASPEELEKPMYVHFDTYKEFERYMSLAKFRQYKRTHCSYNEKTKMCYFHDFASTHIGGFYKPCNGMFCRNYKNFLSVEKMCSDCEYKGTENGNMICTFYQKTKNPCISIDNSEFDNYKCTGYKKKK